MQQSFLVKVLSLYYNPHIKRNLDKQTCAKLPFLNYWGLGPVLSITLGPLFAVSVNIRSSNHPTTGGQCSRMSICSDDRELALKGQMSKNFHESTNSAPRHKEFKEL